MMFCVFVCADVVACMFEFFSRLFRRSLITAESLMGLTLFEE